MGQFINVGNTRFRRALDSKYVDKTQLIAAVNSTLFKEWNMSCVTRCRRFGKSMAASMLCAYYDKSCDSRELFKGLSIAKDPSFEKHLNKYPVIFIDMSIIISRFGHDADIVDKMQKEISNELLEAYPEVKMRDEDDLMDLILRIANHTGEPFLMIIDEWDAICREFKKSEAPMDKYITLLRRFFKGSNAPQAFIGAYITGILPIKKYNTESALNNFWEYTMLSPGGWERHFGFTKKEVEELCNDSVLDFQDLEKWYDGYRIGKERSMFNPNSVIQALVKESCENYWGRTGAFDKVAHYIQMNYDGLKDAVISMLAGEKCPVKYTRFTNDPKRVDSKDDVLTMLIHLGYLSYDPDERKCYIPNLEVREEMENAIRESKWEEVVKTIDASEALLQAVLDGDAETVAAGIEQVHQDEVSILSYNNENSLACVISLAFYAARNNYMQYRELPAGKGFADIVFIPWRNVDSPVLLIELKYDKSARTAINQIKEKNYPDKLKKYVGKVLMVGINYDPDTKKHTCSIEKA